MWCVMLDVWQKHWEMLANVLADWQATSFRRVASSSGVQRRCFVDILVRASPQRNVLEGIRSSADGNMDGEARLDLNWSGQSHYQGTELPPCWLHNSSRASLRSHPLGEQPSAANRCCLSPWIWHAGMGNAVKCKHSDRATMHEHRVKDQVGTWNCIKDFADWRPTK